MHYLLFLFFKNLLQITLEIMLLPISISDEQKVSHPNKIGSEINNSLRK